MAVTIFYLIFLMKNSHLRLYASTSLTVKWFHFNLILVGNVWMCDTVRILLLQLVSGPPQASIRAFG